jgi:hypothetical protein
MAAAAAAAGAEKGIELRGHRWILRETEYVYCRGTHGKECKGNSWAVVEGEGIELGELWRKQHVMLHKLDCIFGAHRMHQGYLEDEQSGLLVQILEKGHNIPEVMVSEITMEGMHRGA